MASLIVAWLGGGTGASGLAISFLYTVCIGGCCSAAGHWAWPRLTPYPPLVRWAGRAASMGLAVCVGTLVALAVLTGSGLLRPRDFLSAYWANLQFAGFMTVTVGGTLMMYEYWRTKYEISELERERALKLATEARLASLESRIHPHFLFNTLNSISSLIPVDPARADAQLQRLSALLRFSLDSSETPLVPLRQELQIVRDYLDIEKTRFGDRLRYEVDIPDELSECRVPPLSVQTLVENSVKHVIAPSRAGGAVRVLAARDGERIAITVADGGPGVAAGSLASGHGLDNLRARLEVVFSGRARLVFDVSAVRMEVPV